MEGYMKCQEKERRGVNKGKRMSEKEKREMIFN